MYNIYFQATALIYVVLLIVLFHQKKKIDSPENRIYSLLVITNLVGVILDIGSIIISNTSINIEISRFVCKAYLVYLIFNALIFSEYVLLIIKKETTPEEKMVNYRNIHKFMLVAITVIAVIILNLPLSMEYENGVFAYTSGPGALVTYIFCGTSFVTWMILIIIYRKNIVFKQVIPVILCFLIGCAGAIIQFIIPTLLLVTFTSVFVTFVLYFTLFQVENPDLEMIEKITTAKKEAERANKSKTDFLSNMSHEIRTPLNAILGFSQGLLEEDLNEGAKNDIEDIVSASDSLLEIVNEILDISKYESNKLEVVDVEYPFDNIYKYLVTFTESKIGSSQLNFIHMCDNRIPPVLYGDYVRIQQIAVNLLTNAIKYTKQGYVKLKIGYENIDKDNCRLIISVEDSGVGIKEENIDKLFSKYECQDDSKSAIEGTGLGLALTKRLVNLMKGKIEVESTLGKGSKFTVTVDQKIVHKTKEEVEAANPTLKRRSFVGHGEKILIVDDNSVNLKVACRLMKNYNLQIELASSGKECINKVASNKYDLVMLDDMMPEMNGVETLQILKQQRGYKTPTVALTANAVSGMKEKYLEEGFTDYLSKPIDKLLLEELLNKYLDGSTASNKEINDSTPKAVIIKDNEEKKVEPVRNTSEVAEKKEIPVVNEMPKEIPSAPVETQPENKVAETGNEKGNVEYLKSNGVDMDAALELLGDMEMYDETVNDFCQEVDQKIADIKKFHDAQDMPNYAILVHSLKSDSKYIGLMHLAELAYNHEMASKGNDVDFVNKNYDELMQEADKMISIIKKYAGK